MVAATHRSILTGYAYLTATLLMSSVFLAVNPSKNPYIKYYTPKRRI